MSLPLKTRLFWTLTRALEFAPAMQQPADKVRAAADLRARLMASRLSRPVVGTTHPGAVGVDRTLSLRDGTVLPLRVYRPRALAGDRLPVVVNFHGGGWVSGNIQQSEWWASTVAVQAGVVVVSVGYRLAPEFPYPTATEDCYAATDWVAKHAGDLGVDPARLAVMGDSAGGNLAAVVALMARDRGGPKVAYQVLLYPAVELVRSFPSEQENAEAPILGKADIDNVPRLYFHGVTQEMTEPYASPLRADLKDLPPALIQTAQFDPLRDQGYAYADALRKAGVEVRHTNYVHGVHGFISLPGVVPIAHQAVAETAETLRRALGRSRGRELRLLPLSG